jgi:tetratricopeptide (TPR) repeat protein
LKKCSRILVGAGCAALLLISWLIAVNSKSTAEIQLELMRQAAELMSDGIYIRAVPLLEEAAGYNAKHTLAAEEKLKRAYIALMDTRGMRRKYTGLLDKQMSRRDAQPGIFAEAANFHLSISRIPEALEILKAGIERTGSAELAAIYEANRYAFEKSRTSYDYVLEIHEATVQVQIDGLWGIAKADGVLIIPCEYESISTFSADRAVVKKNGEIYAVDKDNNRVARLNVSASGFGNFANDRIPVLIEGAWRRATGDLSLGTAAFEQLGMYSGGYVAAKVNGKWGVIDLSLNWLVPAEYDGVVLDELGRCYAQGAVFIVQGGAVYMFAGGRQAGGAFEDARPFSNEGYAAVKRGGKWGFVDANGEVMIDFMFDDALSFGQHLAAVKLGELWGYIGISGRIVIEPAFLEAKSFSSGSAPVLTERGWQFISLLEYRRGPSL